MTRDDVLNIVVDLISLHSGISRDLIRADSLVQEELGLDSLDAVELLVALENRLHRTFEIKEGEHIDSVEDIVDRILLQDDLEATASFSQSDPS